MFVVMSVVTTPRARLARVTKLGQASGEFLKRSGSKDRLLKTVS